MNAFNKQDYYTITGLAKELGVSFKIVFDKVEAGELKPDYIAPFTGKKFFKKTSVQKLIKAAQ